MTASNGNGPARPLVLLCECAGTLTNIDFDRLEQHAGLHADVIRGTHWCSRVGQAQMLELMDAGAGGEAGRRAAARLRRLLRRLRRAPLPEAPGARPPARDRRHPRGLQLGPRRRRRRGHRQGRPRHRLVDRLPGRPRGHDELRRAPRHRRGRRRRRRRHAGRRRARPDGPPRRAGRAAAVPRRPRRPHRHRVPHQRLRPVPADHRRPGRHAQVLPPQRRHRPPGPQHPPPLHRRGGHRPPRRLPGEHPHAPQHRHRRLHQLRHLRDGVRGRVLGARQEGDLHRVLRRPRDPHRRPRDLHLLRQVRRRVPRGGDRLRAVAEAHHGARRRDPHGHRLRAGAAAVLRLPRLRARRRRHPGRAGGHARRLDAPRRRSAACRSRSSS